MRSLTQRKARKYSAESGHSPTPVLTTAQNGQQEYAVVVLGVMYPKVRSREPANTAGDDVLHLPPHITRACQSPAVVFYDPFAASGENGLMPHRLVPSNNSVPRENKYQNGHKGSPRVRAEAIEAVARDLARLLANSGQANRTECTGHLTGSPQLPLHLNLRPTR